MLNNFFSRKYLRAQHDWNSRVVHMSVSRGSLSSASEMKKTHQITIKKCMADYVWAANLRHLLCYSTFSYVLHIFKYFFFSLWYTSCDLIFFCSEKDMYYGTKSSLSIFLLRNLVVYCWNVDIFIVLKRYSTI